MSIRLDIGHYHSDKASPNHDRRFGVFSELYFLDDENCIEANRQFGKAIKIHNLLRLLLPDNLNQSGSIPDWFRAFKQDDVMLHSRSMAGAKKRFCVLTVGRSGSTSLMNALGKFPDIAMPKKNMPGLGDELFHPKKLQARMKRYAELCGTPIASAHHLMECFFAHNAGTAYAGFKTMPNRHKNFGAFVARRDIQFITLIRRDIPSTVASFLMAIRTNSWQRFGEPQPVTWTFVASRDGKRVLGNLAYVRQSLARLSRVPNAIALAYEDLCDVGYRNAALDDFFARAIQIENPKPPTSGRAYVENWDEFCAFIGEVPAGE